MAISVHKTFSNDWHKKVFTIYLFFSSLLILLFLIQPQFFYAFLVSLKELKGMMLMLSSEHQRRDNQGYWESGQAVRTCTIKTMTYNPLICQSYFDGQNPSTVFVSCNKDYPSLQLTQITLKKYTLEALHKLRTQQSL